MARSYREWTPEPELQAGEEAIGRQRSSLRPSSASYTIGRGQRNRNTVCNDSPGPANYASAPSLPTGAPAAFFGTAVQGGLHKPYQYPDVEDVSPDTADCVKKASVRPVFGREERGREYTDPEVIRNNPQVKYNREGPGPIYAPNYASSTCGQASGPGRRRRPSSAPSYSFTGRSAATATATTAPASEQNPDVAPDSYSCEVAFGVQRDSRRKTSRSASFGRSSRFGPSREAQGQATAECANVRSTLGGCQAGRPKQRRAPAATFGVATRSCSAKTRICAAAGDRPPSAGLGRPLRLPHPPTATHQERVRWDSRA